MSKLLRRPTRVTTCFYCQSDVDPHNPRSFKCPECHCWNRFDAKGEIISDEPAMHDENLNARSFARRASPRKDRIPTVYGKGLFCHTCQTNQMLLANLLSNYLPSPTDPEYAKRLEMYPSYKESIEIRYPPVCEQCQPAIDEEIRKRDDMARTRALGGFLKESRGKGRQRQVSMTYEQKEKFEKALWLWRVRGGLWAGTLVLILIMYGSGAAGYGLPRIPTNILPMLPAASVLSIFWSAWDPTYAVIRRDQIQGRTVRQKGKQEYIILQCIVWITRLTNAVLYSMPYFRPSWDNSHLQDPTSYRARLYTSVFLFVEVSILIRSLFVLRIQRPPAVHLQDDSSRRPGSSATPSLPSSRSATPATAVDSPELLSSLSLNGLKSLNGKFLKPTTSPSPLANPIFGLPSLPTALSIPNTHSSLSSNGDTSTDAMDEDDGDEERTRDPNAMDWTPTSTSAKTRRSKNKNEGKGEAQVDDASWIRPQRFFAPEEPTGLEHLFAKTIKLADSDDQSGSSGGKVSEQSGVQVVLKGKQVWMLVTVLCAVVVVPLLAMGYKLWERSRKPSDVLLEPS